MSRRSPVSRALVCTMLVVAVGCQRTDEANYEKRVGTSEQLASVADASAVSTGQEDLVLGSDELTHQQTLGLDGDGSAALKVAMHYAQQSIVNRRYIEDAKYWFVVAAENGSPGGMINHAQQIYEAGGRVNCRRALFWLKRADDLVDDEVSRSSVRGWQGQISSEASERLGHCQ